MPLGNFDYGSREVSAAIQEQLNMTDFGFIGVSVSRVGVSLCV